MRFCRVFLAGCLCWLSVGGVAQVGMSLSTTGPNMMVPGLPFQAERVTKTARTIGDGSKIEREQHEILARDADGRIYDESKIVSGAAVAAGQMGPTILYVVIDPVAKRTVRWNTLNTTAMTQYLNANTHIVITALPTSAHDAPTVPKDQNVVATKDLGTKTVAGLEAKGERTTTTIAVGAMGNEKELVITKDVWTSDELKLTLEETESNPFTGTRSSTIVSLKRTAPDANLFRVPDGYTLKEFQMPSLGGMVASMSPTYMKALDDVTKPETREKAADDLVAYAQTHPDVANHVAHVLAARGTHLEDADKLARSSVERLEKTMANVDLDHLTIRDMNNVGLLAEYWDSLGWVRHAQGDKDATEKYCEIAWRVGGEGLYIEHVAKLDIETDHKPAAIHLLELAMSGKADKRETDADAKLLADLGVSSPVAVVDPEVVAVEDVEKMEGKADFYLEFVKQRPPVVHWASGDSRLTVFEAAVSRANYAAQIPDDGPERVVRRGQLVCTEGACRLTLLYAWQANALTPRLSVAPGRP